MDAEILLGARCVIGHGAHCVIGHGAQNNFGNMDHKIVLNLQFCQDYVFVAGRKDNTEADHPQH